MAKHATCLEIGVIQLCFLDHLSAGSFSCWAMSIPFPATILATEGSTRQALHAKRLFASLEDMQSTLFSMFLRKPTFSKVCFTLCLEVPRS